MEVAISNIQKELADRLEVLRNDNKLLEAQRLEQRTNYDIEMLRNGLYIWYRKLFSSYGRT